MSTITAKPLSHYPWFIRFFFWKQKRTYGRILDPGLLWGRSPWVFAAVALLYGALDRKSSPIAPALRSLVTVRVSQINHCAFCVDINSATLAKRGVSMEKIGAISNWRDNAIFEPEECLALEYAEAITIGGLYIGWFTPTEAASIGAGGALLLGSIFGELSWEKILTSFAETVRTTCTLFVIVIFAVTFSYFVTQSQLPQAVATWMSDLHLGRISLIVVLTVFYIVLGCFMEGFGMILITVPVFLPVLMQNGYSPIWFGVMLVIVIELGLIHPPVGMNIFVIQAQVREIPIGKIYKGILPFLIAPLVLLGLIVAMPDLVMWLPRKLFN